MTASIQRRSPWIEQLDRNQPPRPLAGDTSTDVVVIGAGIAGVATAFFLLAETDFDVLLIERDRAGHGATGHNGGQLTTYFERPLYDLVDTYGFDRTMAAQRAIDGAWQLLDQLVDASNADVRIDRFIGHMGMFTLDHVSVHLRSSWLRRKAGLFVPSILIAETAPFLAEVPATYADLYTTVPMEHIRRLLGTTDNRFSAVMSDMKGCANGALLIEQVLAHLLERFPDRFGLADHTAVHRVVLESDHAEITAGEHQVSTSHVVMCTNGFVDHVVENRVGSEIRPHMHHRVTGDVGYMVGFFETDQHEPTAQSYIRNEMIGGDTPYVYVTSRPWDGPSGAGTLTCIGGPEQELDDASFYDPTWEFPDHVIAEVDSSILPIVCPTRQQGLRYDYAWHGLMAYTDSRVRLIGFEPKNHVLLYNLGCNGVGFLPSIFGGYRIARLLGGDDLEPSIFDPP